MSSIIEHVIKMQKTSNAWFGTAIIFGTFSSKAIIFGIFSSKAVRIISLYRGPC